MSATAFKLSRTFRKLWDGFWVIWLAQVLWLALCLPVITIPLAFAGLYTSAHAVASGESTSWKTFFSGIRQYLWPAVKWSLINLLALGLLLYDVWFFSHSFISLPQEWKTALQILVVTALTIWFMVNLYTFPFILTQEKPSYRLALRNSLVMFLKWPGMVFSFTILILCVFALAVTFRFFWVIFAASLPAFLACSCVQYAIDDMIDARNEE